MLGDDFSFKDSETVFSSFEHIIKFTSENYELMATEVLFSTPKQYMYDLIREYKWYGLGEDTNYTYHKCNHTQYNSTSL